LLLLDKSCGIRFEIEIRQQSLKTLALNMEFAFRVLEVSKLIGSLIEIQYHQARVAASSSGIHANHPLSRQTV
jgi:hypothetical protein